MARRPHLPANLLHAVEAKASSFAGQWVELRWLRSRRLRSLCRFLIADIALTCRRQHSDPNNAMAKMPPPPDNLLSDLPPELQTRLFAKARSISLAPDQTLFLPGDPGDGCYRLDEGLLKVSVISPGGGERILAILGPGAMVGELSMLDGTMRSASVSALRDSKLCFISRAAFETFANGNPEVYRHGMILLARRLRYTNEALAATSFMSLKGRVARALLSPAEAFGHEVGSDVSWCARRLRRPPRRHGWHLARERQPHPADWTRRSIVSRLSGHYCVESKAKLWREAEA